MTTKKKTDIEGFETTIKKWSNKKIVDIFIRRQEPKWQRYLLFAEILERGEKTPTPEDWKKFE
jgi:hypothetical protein